MQIGIIGLGRMGGNIVRRLIRHGHETVVYDRDQKAVTGMAGEGAAGASGLEELVRSLAKPREGWGMVPAGALTEDTIRRLVEMLDTGDVVIDGGNTVWN